MHLTDDDLQRLIDGEPAGGDARAHLMSCGACRERATIAEREQAEVFARLGALDAEPPVLRVEDVMRARPLRPVLRWAAGIAIAAGIAGGAYLAPGSPLPAWLHVITQWVAGQSDAPQSSPAPRAPDSPRGGVAVAPGESLDIVFTIHSGAAHAAVALTDDPEVSVQLTGGRATFASARARLTIAAEDGASLDVRIPRTARLVEARTGSVVVLRVAGGRVTTRAPADAAGRYSLALTP